MESISCRKEGELGMMGSAFRRRDSTSFYEVDHDKGFSDIRLAV
jgi:hypothetical protein